MSERQMLPPSWTQDAAGELTRHALRAKVAAVVAGVSGVEADQEARDLIAAILDLPRFWPTLSGDVAVRASDIDRVRQAAQRRASGMPFAYAVRRAAFRHLTLSVDERVLIPRQETEQLVQEVLDATTANAGGLVLDVGTGSGAIALALATEGRFDRVIGTDVSLGALAVARANALRIRGALRAAVEFRHGSLLAPVQEVRAQAIVCNPPYIAHDEAPNLPASVRNWEPPVALFSAGHGMTVTRTVIRDAANLLASGGLLALELDARRASLAAEAAASDGRYVDVHVRLDLAGRERFLLATRM